MALFGGSPISSYFDQIRKQIKDEIYSYDYRQLKAFSDSEINSIIDRYKEQNVGVDFQNVSMSASNGQEDVYNYNCQMDDDAPENVSVKGKTITVLAPISGNPSLLKYSFDESNFNVLYLMDKNYQKMDVDFGKNPAAVVFSFFIQDNELNGKDKTELNSLIKKKREEYIKATVQKIDRLNSIINGFNKQLPEFARECLDTKIHDDSTLDFLSEAIGIDVQPRNEFQDLSKKIEVLPKKVDITLPNRKKYKGYYLEKNSYSAIISTIKNHLIATENNPAAIKRLNNEELIRDTILWALNSNYIVAQGESFRNSGKTDILISFNDKSVFIAECKIWNGKKYFLDGLKQLLSYSTWRDSKLSMIIFNTKNKDFSSVCKEAKEVIKEYDGFKRVLSESEPNFLECELTDSNNAESVITLTLICANYVGRN